jgi:hypothetical protein
VYNLVFFFFFTALGSRLLALALDTTSTATTVWRGQGEVNVLLGFKADHETWDINSLLANTDNKRLANVYKGATHSGLPDVSLLDQNTSVVNALGQTQLEDLSLKAALQEIFNLQTKHVIQLGSVFGQDTSADQSSDQSVTLEKTLVVLLIQGQKLTSSTTDVGKSVTDSPDLTLVSETVDTAKLQFLVHAFGLIWATRNLGGL